MATDAGGTAWIDFRGDFSEVRRDAEREGSRAGDSFGRRFTVDAAGRLRNERGQFASAGTEAGEAFGDGASQGAESEGSGGISQWLGGLGGSMGTAAAAGGLAIGVAIGGAAVVGLQQAVDEEGTINLLEARLGAGSPLAEDAGRAAGEVYRNGFGESLGEAGEAVQLLIEGGVISADEGTQEEMETLGSKALDVASIFGQDLPAVVNGVGQLMRTGLAPDAETAFDIITRGFQEGVDKSDDYLDTLNEYSTAFRDLGLDGEEATALLSQGLGAGARDSDLVADALKEFNIRAKDGSEDSVAGFEALGISADDAMAAIASGGEGAQDVLMQTLDALRGIDDAELRSDIATKLFGTQAEDLQDALFALDADPAALSLGNLEGALQTASDEAASGAGAKFETFKRKALGGLADFMGRNVLPGLTALGEGAIDVFGQIRTAWNEGGISGVMSTLGGMWEKVWPVLQAKGREFFGKARTWIATEGPGIARKIGDGFYAAGNWLVQNWPTFAGKMAEFYGKAANWIAEVAAPWLGAKAMELGPKLWQWIQDAWPPFAQRMAEFWGQAAEWIATTAVPWLLQKGNDLRAALTDWAINDAGPALLRGLVSAKASLETWFTQTAIPWLKRKALDWFAKLKEGADERREALMTWFERLPGVIGQKLNGLPGRLLEAGMNAIDGFIGGIQRRLPNLEAIITGLGDMVPDWVKRALGIKSPSRVFMGIGENVVDGFIVGIESSTDRVGRALNNMLTDPMAGFANGTETLQDIIIRSLQGVTDVLNRQLFEDGSYIDTLIGGGTRHGFLPGSIAAINAGQYPSAPSVASSAQQAVSASSLPYIPGTLTATGVKGGGDVNFYTQATDWASARRDAGFDLRRMGVI